MQRDIDHHSPGESIEQRRFIAQLLLASHEQIASQAATMLVERWEDIAARYKPLAFDRWCENLQGRVADLASSIHAGRPQVFVRQVIWSAVAFEKRGVPRDDLQRSLDVLGEVLDRNIPAEDRAYVMGYLREAGKELYKPVVEPPTNLSIETPQGETGARYLLAVLEGDRFAASRVVTDAVAAKRIGVREVYEQVLGPVQQELGRLWHMNDLTVAEEHFATATTAMVMSQLYPHLPRKPRHGKVVVAASVQGNQHDLGVRMVCDYFEMEGWRAVYLGANVPGPDLGIAVEHFGCDLLCLSAYLPTQLRAVEDTIACVRGHEAGQRCKVLVGGPAFLGADVLWREIGADGYAQSAQDAVCVGARLVGV